MAKVLILVQACSAGDAQSLAGPHVGGTDPAAIVRVSLVPPSAQLMAGDSLALVAWEHFGNGDSIVAPAVTYSATGGTVTSGGFYMAGSVAGSFRVIVTQTGGTLADTSVVTITAASGSCVGSATVVCPGESIQAKVDAAGAGTAFTIRAGVHRGQSVVPKSGNTFTGEPGAILSGAKVLTGWAQDGSRWYITGQTQGSPSGDPNVCDVESPLCDNPEDLWIDNVLKKHVATLAEVGPGTWFFDYAGDRIYVGDTPTGKTVETSVTEYAISSTAANVTIEGLTIEKYSNKAQTGAIGGIAAGSGWMVRNNEIRSNHGIGLRGGGGMQAIGNNVHHNGQMGLGGQFALVEDNEIAYNNTAGYNPWWEAGGSKFTFTNGLVVRGNFVHHNFGSGLWTDIDNINTLYENNRVEDNELIGIFHEISFSAVIRNNIVRRNGGAQTGYIEGMGILIATSTDVEVYGNAVEDNQSGGIFGINDNRGSGTLGAYLLKNLWVHDNTIQITRGYAAGIGAQNGDLGVFGTYNNRWDRNTYRVAAAVTQPFSWNMPPDTWTQWRGFGQDAGGSLSTY